MDVATFKKRLSEYLSASYEQGGGIGTEAFHKPILPLPCETDFLAIVDTFAEIPPDDLAAIRESLTMDQSYRLIGFSVRMAVLAVRRRDPAILRRSIVVWFVLGEENHLDWRDEIVNKALVRDCADRLGIDLRGAFLAYKKMASPRRWQQIVGEKEWPTMVRGIDDTVMGYKGRKGPEGFEYIRWP